MFDFESFVNESAFFTYIWTIENMCAPCFLESPIFTVQAIDITKWCLAISIDGSGTVCIVLQRIRDDYGDEVTNVKFELSILGINGLPLKRGVNAFTFDNEDDHTFMEIADQNEIFCQRRIEFLPRDVLTIRCRMWRINEISKPDLCFAHTILRTEKCSFVWSIKEFSSFQVGQKRKILLNPTAKEVIQVRLMFFLREENGEQYFYIKLLAEDDNIFCWYKINLHLLDISGKTIHFEEKSGMISHMLSFEDFFEKSKLMHDMASLLPNDVLSMRCEFELLAKVSSRIENYLSSEIEDTMSEMNKVNIGEQNETSFIKSLLEEETLSDVNLQAGLRSFPAHKCILSARSPIFKAMFNRNIETKTSKDVEIPDVDEKILERLLSYIYKNTVGELLWPDAEKLYTAAEKYKLLGLKRICSTFLKSNVSLSNVCSVLVLADMHHDQELKKTMQDYIMNQDEEFFTFDEWRCFKEENSKLALETLERIVRNIKRDS